MITSVIYNYRTDKDANQFFDSFTVGEDSAIIANRVVTVRSLEMNWSDYSVEVFCFYEIEEEGKPPIHKDLQITQRNIHQVIQEY